jgi:tetratricopeptide (TPR) repeat protein
LNISRKIFFAFVPFIFGGMLFAQSPAAPGKGESELLTAEGTVQVMVVGGSGGWQAAHTNSTLHVGDRVRTGARSRATVRLSDLTVLRVNELTTLQIRPPLEPGKQSLLDLHSGSAYFLSREKPPEQEFRTPLTSGAIRGTEFNLAVAEDGRTVVTLIDGQVSLSNTLGQVEMNSGEQGIVDPGKPPVKTAMLEAANIIQWCLYYPGVVDADELPFTDGEKQSLGESLAAYRAGDLVQALAVCPWEGEPGSQAVRIYRAALLLSVGQVEKTEALLRDAQPSPQLTALQQMIAVTKFATGKTVGTPTTASEWVAESYVRQSRNDLKPALIAARMATTNAPNFGFAWERVAELEFSFGHIADAHAALNKALQLSPRNAQALALRGFLLSANNDIREALTWFDRAIAADGGLGNAWLGRGLCLIHEGHEQAGLRDLVVAASSEPTRSLLRSYLGKAFTDVGNDSRAQNELKLARNLDPRDPTSWLYLALLHQQENRVNEAVSDLQTSQKLNDNRSLFRSRLLLDQDRAVGSANLATMYRDLGMTDVSVREASKAVTSDYANDSAHLFLSDAYNDLRDPTQFNLRYETVYFNELLLANILAPLGGGRLSQGVSQQEYSKLFEADGPHFANTSDYRTDGMYHQLASLYGVEDKTAYSLDLDYHHNSGFRINNKLDDVEINATVKQQVTDADTALLLVQYQNYHSGDNFQYYDQNDARPNFRFDEQQEPIVVGAWHHEWAPGIHTLGLVGRLVDQQHFTDSATPQLLGFQTGGVFDPSVPFTTVPLNVDYQNNFEIYSAELNQIMEWDRVSISAGGRYQTGNFHSSDLLGNASPGLAPLFNPNGTASQDAENNSFNRYTGYAYLTVEPIEHLWLTGGAAYDQVSYPNNYRSPPVANGEAFRQQLGPKAALVWSPCDEATFRGIYSRSLGGVSLDESYRLEPTQLAGFPQAFRSLISESLVGSVTAPTYEVIGTALDLKLGTRTYAGIQAQRLGTTIQGQQGLFALADGAPPVVPLNTPQYFDYKEYSLGLNLNQLISDNFVVGLSYKLTQADERDFLGNVPAAVLANDQTTKSHLHNLTGYLLYNSRSGFFAKSETQWYEQENFGFTPVEPGDEFFQQNFYAGYRFLDRRVELTLALLNVTGQNYHLSPLTVYQELPRKRVFEARLNFVF